MSNADRVAIACIAILAFIAAFHFYWGLGGKVGMDAAVPQRETGEPLFKPSAVASHAVGLALSAAALCVLAYSGFVLLPVPFQAIRAIVALLAVIFTVRALGWFRYAGFFKAVRDTTFGKYDTWLYCPLCLLLGLGLLYVLVKPCSLTLYEFFEFHRALC